MKTAIIKDLKKSIYWIIPIEILHLFFGDFNKKNNDFLLTIYDGVPSYKNIKSLEKKENQWVYPIDIELNMEMQGISFIPALKESLMLN